MNTKLISAISLVIMIALGSYPPSPVLAQGCLEYDSYQHWVTALRLENYSNEVIIEDNYAYVALGSVFQGWLAIVDISVPDAPLQVGAVAVPGNCLDVAVAGGHAYVASGREGLQVVDVSDPTAPVVVGTLTVTEFAGHVDLIDHYAVVADTDTDQLFVIDVADPQAPAVVGKVSGVERAKDLVIAEGFAFVLYRFLNPTTAGILIFDLADPLAPSLVCDLPVNPASTLIVKDGRLYVPHSSMQIFDVSDPASPTLLGTMYLPQGGISMTVSGDYAYVSSFGTQNYLTTVDISQPTQPAVTGAIATHNFAKGLAISGHHAFLADNIGLSVIDVSSPIAAPDGVVIPTPLYPYSLTIGGEYAYLAGAGAENLQVIGLSDPLNPALLGTSGTPGGIRSLVVVGQHVYAADDSTGLHVIDVSNPDAPEIVDVVSAGGIAMSLAADENHLFATYRDEATSWLQVMDITAPAAPTVVGSVAFPHLVGSIAFAENLIYVVNRYGASSSGLTIVDVTEPEAPVVVGVTDTLSYNISNLTIEDDVAYLVGWFNGLTMIDISNPTLPMVMGNVLLPGNGSAVTVRDDRAYVAVPRIGLVIVDLTNPNDGFVVGVADTGVSVSFPREVVFANGHLFLAGSGGLGVVLPQCADPVAVFFSGLTVSFAPNAVQLQWQVTAAGELGEFQIVGRQAGRRWFISDYQHDGTNFVAVDDAANWAAGEPLTYSLYWRQAGTDWQLLGTETVERDVVAHRLGLGQIHPNPFNPNTLVSFSVGQAQQVEIAVYDLLGRRIAVLADQVFDAGEHTTRWDGRDATGRTVSSGTYLVRFAADQYLESRKIMLVR